MTRESMYDAKEVDWIHLKAFIRLLRLEIYE